VDIFDLKGTGRPASSPNIGIAYEYPTSCTALNQKTIGFQQVNIINNNEFDNMKTGQENLEKVKLQ